MIKLVYSSEQQELRDLDTEAMEWVVRLTSGESLPEDHEQFRRWRDQSDLHYQALQRARLMWQTLGDALPKIEQRRSARATTRRWILRGLPIAASLLLTVGLTTNIFSAWRYDVVTAAGEQRSLVLPDGSRIVMSGNSAVDLDFRPGIRAIEVARGEVLFDVLHDAARPFVVHAGDGTYRDVGTVFSIRRRGSDSDAIVAEGEVEAATGKVNALVSAGQRITVSQGKLGTARQSNVATELAWVRGRLIFRNRSLNEILAMLEPHYAGHVFVLNGQAGKVRLSASIELDHVDEWLDALYTTNGINVTRVGSVTVLT